MFFRIIKTHFYLRKTVMFPLFILICFGLIWTILTPINLGNREFNGKVFAADTNPTNSIPPTVSFKVAESEQGLDNAPINPYTNDPTIFNYILNNTTPGIKQIWVEFISSSGQTSKSSINVELAEADPVIETADCKLDITKEDVLVNITGQRFGETPGKLTANNQDAKILGWNDATVSAKIKRPSISTNESQDFKLNLIRTDKQSISTVCTVGVTQLSLGAKIFCREEGKFDQSNVHVTIIDENNKKVDETATISKEGLIQNLQSKLQVGKQYTIYVKAPKGLRRSGKFIAGEGTLVIQRFNGGDFVLPVGDIFPAAGDGVINAADKAELNREWGVLASSTKDTSGDFNKDNKINSFDWACMRYDFGQRDDIAP